MKDITILVPLTEPSVGMSDIQTNYMNECINNINNCEQYYDGKLLIKFIFPEKDSSYDSTISDDPEIEYLHNYGETDYCSQINFGVEHVETEYFAIMEMDDQFNPKWFKMFNEYLNTKEDVSIFLPINVVKNNKNGELEFVNELIWAASFSNEIGYIDFDCLEHSASFNLTGGIFKTSDWLKYKPSIQVSFNYEYLLRATYKNQKVFVIPKEGYYHGIFGENSLSEKYLNEISDDDTQKWFELAKRVYIYDDDKNCNIIDNKVETLS